jgi:hypothetical protein
MMGRWGKGGYAVRLAKQIMEHGTYAGFYYSPPFLLLSSRGNLPRSLGLFP